MQTKRDCYEILGVGRDADEAQIRKAYRKLAKKYHPDSNSGDAGAEEKFKEVSEAYGILSDSEKRKLYDRFGYAAFSEGGAESTGYGADSGGPQNGYYEYHFTGDSGDVDMDDILSGLFGGRFGGASRSGFGGTSGGTFRSGFSDAFGGGFGTSSRGPVRGADLDAELEVGFEEAAFGAKKRVSFPDADGKVRSYEINIPAGIESGKSIRLKGKGMPGGRGGETGDLRIKITVKEKPGFRREGLDLYTAVQIPFATAALGGEIRIDTIHGPVACRIRPGTQSGARIRLKGKGIVSMKEKNVYGDQYAVVEISVPRSLSAEAERKLREFQKALDAQNGSFGRGSAA